MLRCSRLSSANLNASLPRDLPPICFACSSNFGTSFITGSSLRYSLNTPFNLHGFIFGLNGTQTRRLLLRRVCVSGRLQGIYLSEVRFISTVNSQNLTFPWKSIFEFLLYQGKQRMDLVLFNCVCSSIRGVARLWLATNFPYANFFFFGYSITKTFFTCSSEDI